MNTLSLLTPQWRVPNGVIARVSDRRGGVSSPPFDSFNLALHVDDKPASVLENRRLLAARLPSGMVVQWLEQVHGTAVVDACGDGLTRCGDAVYVDTPGFAGAVLTADCLPVLFASRTGRRVAAAHAGWRGLAAGVLENTLARFPESPAQISVWLGPAIGPCHFEVGAEVREIFLTSTPATAASQRLLAQAFRPSASPDRFFADLYALARIRLAACGVTQVSGGSECTFCNTEQFYSYRRDARTGRFVSLIGLAPDQA